MLFMLFRVDQITSFSLTELPMVGSVIPKIEYPWLQSALLSGRLLFCCRWQCFSKYPCCEWHVNGGNRLYLTLWSEPIWLQSAWTRNQKNTLTGVESNEISGEAYADMALR